MGDKYTFLANSSYKLGIELAAYPELKNNNRVLSMDNIVGIDFRPSWIFYYPQLSGNEGNMDFIIDWKARIQCNNIGKEIMF